MLDVGYRCRCRCRCWCRSRIQNVLGRYKRRLPRGAPRSDSGFTLLEALIVLAIGGILAAFALTSVTSARRGYQLQTAGITFSNRLLEARTQALKRNRPIAVTLDVAAGTLRTTFTPPGAAPVEIGGPEFLPSSVIFDLGDAPSLVVTFDAMGRPFNPPQTFLLRQPASGMLRTISVLSTGRVTVN
jgi:prepilin-type N-terminal cleavage/methylation domain-containing protein